MALCHRLCGPGHRESGLVPVQRRVKPLFAGLLGAFAKAVGAGPTKRVVLLLDNAGFHTRPNLAVPDGIRLVYLPPYSPELQPAETPCTLVDEPVVNRFVPNLTKLINTITERCIVVNILFNVMINQPNLDDKGKLIFRVDTMNFWACLIENFAHFDYRIHLESIKDRKLL